MPFERSLLLERRLDAALKLIRRGRYSAPKLSEKIGVSVPTISRMVCALKGRGHNIRAERISGGWQYVLDDQEHRKPKEKG
jgi:predicted DNA-binding transcriptional regulator YafY